MKKYLNLGLAFATLTLASIFIAQAASADTFKGNIQNNGSATLHLTLTAPGQPWDGRDVALVIPASLSVFMHHLHTGDSLTVDGSLEKSAGSPAASVAQILSVDSIDEVGLQQLLGTWRTPRWEIFEFQNFNLLNLYIPTAGAEGGVNLQKTHALKYILTPDAQTNRFSIFMSDDRDVRMGFLEVSESKLTLTVTDFKTGQVTDSIFLSPVHL